MTFEAVIMGCGSSGGVPRPGGAGGKGEWGACDPDEPRNRRRRCSLLVRRGATAVVIDTAPDFREQMLDAAVERLDAVLFTHDHADQTHGIDDLRPYAIRARRRVPVYGDAATFRVLTQRFGYCFETPPGSGYPPILERREIAPGVPFAIEGPGGAMPVVAFEQIHGDITSLGYRIGGLAYSSDVSDLPEASFRALEGLDVWILDALRYAPHPSHAHVEKALDWIARVKPARAILTNLHIDLDYRRLAGELPAGVEPAFDGLTVAFR